MDGHLVRAASVDTGGGRGRFFRRGGATGAVPSGSQDNADADAAAAAAATSTTLLQPLLATDGQRSASARAASSMGKAVSWLGEVTDKVGERTLAVEEEPTVPGAEPRRPAPAAAALISSRSLESARISFFFRLKFLALEWRTPAAAPSLASAPASVSAASPALAAVTSAGGCTGNVAPLDIEF